MVFTSVKTLLAHSVVILVCLRFGSVRSAWIAKQTCQEPSNLEQLKIDLHYKMGKHESHYLVPTNGGRMPTLDFMEKNYPQFVNISIQDYWPNQACPLHNKSLIHASQRNSTCPWSFVVNSDPNRYPKEIMEAKCICGRCLDFLDGKQTTNKCQPVYYTARVLRRTKCNTRLIYEYETVLEPIRAGCMCTSVPLNESGSGVTEGPSPSQ